MDQGSPVGTSFLRHFRGFGRSSSSSVRRVTSRVSNVHPLLRGERVIFRLNFYRFFQRARKAMVNVFHYHRVLGL